MLPAKYEKPAVVSDYSLAVVSLGVGDVPTPVRGCRVSGEDCLTSEDTVKGGKKSLVLGSAKKCGIVLNETGNGIPSVRERPQGWSGVRKYKR
ncbi:hypothetical protein TNCV_1289611 [Trichonephila clavipes]|nr:hypothetical protein TNCV_1289611 [Trichonephila clavipes]